MTGGGGAAPPAWDIHQHLWPAALRDELAARAAPPRLGRRPGAPADLHLLGEPVWPVDERDHDPAARSGLVARDGLSGAVVAPSVPLGAEALTGAEGARLVAAYNAGAAALPAPLRWWAAAVLDRPDPGALGAALDAGAVGLCLAAGALTDPGRVAHLGGLLSLVEARDRPLFVHPGPSPWAPAPDAAVDGAPWWPALTRYVADMQAAWFAVRAWVLPAHPALRVCLAMLAGLAPLHAERARSRGLTWPAQDPRLFYDTSSYGAGAIAAVAAAVGGEAIVFGSDRPVVDPPRAPAPGHPWVTANPLRLLGPAVAGAALRTS
ncbi:MAG: amidohydrolase family protein [Miltoncostaeaceae bacterium]